MTAMIDSLAGQSFTFPKYPPSGVRDQWTSMVQDQVSELVRTNPEEYFISTNSGFQEGVFKKDSQGKYIKGSMRWSWGRRADQNFDWRGQIDTAPNYLYHPFEQKSGSKWDYSTTTMMELQFQPSSNSKDIFRKMYRVLTPYNEWLCSIAISYSVAAFHSTQHRLVHDKN